MTSLFDAVRVARSGLTAFGSAVGVVSNNISNAFTPGFKSSRPQFETVGRTQGVSATSPVRLIEQGFLQPSSRSLDLGISGKGLFVVDTGAGQSYTRAGNFSLNASGTLVTDQGFPVLGYENQSSGALGPLTLEGGSSVSPTSSITISGNLDAQTAVSPPPPGGTIPAGSPPPPIEPVSFTDLSNASQFSSVVDVTDSLGGTREVSLYYTKTAANEFTVQAFARSEDVDPGGSTVGAPRLLGTSTLQFGSDGRRSNIPPPPSQDFSALALPVQGGADPNQQLNISLENFTQFAAPSSIQSLTNNGRGVGDVLGVSVESTGEVVATFTNGDEQTIGRVALADFPNPEGLVSQGGNLLGQTLESGTPRFSAPDTGNVGSIEGNSLEASTVDLTKEFVDLIAYSQGFKANAKVLKITGELTDELLDVLA